MQLTPEQNETFMAFITAVKAFCDAVDAHDKMSLGKFLRHLALRITRLYAAALQLPNVISEASDNSSEPRPDAFSHEQEAALTDALEKKLGSYNTYREIFDPYDEPSEEAVY